MGQERIKSFATRYEKQYKPYMCNHLEMKLYGLLDYQRVLSQEKYHNAFPKEVYLKISAINAQVFPICVDDARKVWKRPVAKKEFAPLPFKTTKLEQKDGVEKEIQQFRTVLNKISESNFDKQRDLLVEMIKRNEESDLKAIAAFLFEIASSNQFYASLYASLYKEFLGLSPIFHELLTAYLTQFITNMKDIKYMDPDVDYDGYCKYNKSKGAFKGTTMFFVHLMKFEVVPVTKILSIIAAIQEIIVLYLEDAKKIQEIECMSEILYVFLHEGQHVFGKTEWIWKFRIVPHIIQVSQYTKKDKAGLSSKTIFKYMDMREITCESAD